MKLTLLIFCSFFTSLSFSQAGTPVNGFGTNGQVVTSIGSASEKVHDLVVQPDGKLIAVGYTVIGSDHHAALIRYNPNGTLDNTFGTAGIVTTSFAGNLNNFFDAEIQPDGKIVVAGQVLASTLRMALIRYNPNGTPDNSFGTNGVVIVPQSAAATAAVDIIIQPDGKILVGGRGGPASNDFTFARFNINGTSDNSFDGDGVAFIGIGVASDDLQAIALQPDGKIIGVGFSSITVGTSTTIDIVVVRLNPDGTPDNSFDGDGKLTTAVGTSNDNAYDVALQPDGKILVVGSTIDFASYNLMAIRYNIDGSLDNSFDDDGKVIIDFTTQDHFRNVYLQNDGKILIAGDIGVDIIADQKFAVVRLNSNGSLDNNFDADGYATMTISTTAENKAGAMAITNGRIYVGGFTAANGTEDFVVAAFNNDGIPLPVKLVSFTGIAKANEAKIEWKLAGNIQGSSITLLKSTNGRDFIPISQQVGRDNEALQSFTDLSFNVSPSYYQIRIVEKSGFTTYGSILTLHGKHIENITAYPNPVKGQVFIQTTKAGIFDIRLLNNSGKTVRMFKLNAIANGTQMLDVSNVAKGIYVLAIYSVDGITSLPVMIE